MLTPHGGAKPAFGVSTSTCILDVAMRGLCNAASVMNFPSPHLDALLKTHASILQFVLLPYNFSASLCHDERFANATLVQRDRVAYFLRQRARHMLLQVPRARNDCEGIEHADLEASSNDKYCRFCMVL